MLQVRQLAHTHASTATFWRLDRNFGLQNRGCNPVPVCYSAQIATSNWLQPRSYLIFNCILAIVFVAFQLLNLYDAIPVLRLRCGNFLVPMRLGRAFSTTEDCHEKTPTNCSQTCQYCQVLGGYYFIYLTVWALVLQTITMVMLFICTLWAYVKLTDGPDGPSQGQAPLFVRYTVAFWYIIQPVSMNFGCNNLHANESDLSIKTCCVSKVCVNSMSESDLSIQ